MSLNVSDVWHLFPVMSSTLPARRRLILDASRTLMQYAKAMEKTTPREHTRNTLGRSSRSAAALRAIKSLQGCEVQVRALQEYHK